MLSVTYMAVLKSVSKWVKEDPAFANFIYLGRYPPSITPDEFLEIEERLHSNPLEVKSYILSDLQDSRKIRGEKPISTSTFYRWITVFTDYLDWFKIKNIKIPSTYSVEEARESLSKGTATISTYTYAKELAPH